MKKSLVLTTAAILAATGIASADELSLATKEARSTKVLYSRAVAQSSAGAQELYQRLKAAARMVCADASMELRVGGSDMVACRTSALDAAVQDVNVPAVSALHTRKGTVEVLASR